MQSPHPTANFHQPHKCISFMLLFVLSTLLYGCVQGEDYLKEAPTFLIPCVLSDPKSDLCLAKAIENVFTNWKNGIPGLTGLGSIDPFQVKKLHFVQNNQNVNLKLDLKDMQVTGLSKTKVSKATVSDEYNFKVLVKVPKLQIKADYKAKGTILLLNLNSTGSVVSELTDIELFFTLKAKLLKINKQSFFDISTIQSSVKNIGNFHINFDNLFDASPELSESANTVFNENWHEFFEILRPAIEETLDAVLIDRHKKIFSYVPANFFFIDLP